MFSITLQTFLCALLRESSEHATIGTVLEAPRTHDADDRPFSGRMASSKHLKEKNEVTIFNI